VQGQLALAAGKVVAKAAAQIGLENSLKLLLVTV